MSRTHQEDTSTQPEPTGAPVTGTPAKKKYEPDLAYASAPKTFEEARNQLGTEMEGRWLGAMPVDKFLRQYLPAPAIPLPDLPANPFQNVPSTGVESERCEPFIVAIQEWMPNLCAVNTSNKEDTVNNVKLKTDISVYNRVDGVTPPQGTNFSRMELWMEFKAKSSGAAFRDPKNDSEEERLSAIRTGSFTPDTMDGRMARGQLAHYAGALHSKQFRHFSFSVIVHGDQARFLRWDPSGTVVTAAFNYRTDPKSMAEFFWRFNHLSPQQRGYDVSVERANLVADVDARVREKLGIKDKVPLYRYEIPGINKKGYAYGPRPPTQNRSLVSRCTRNLPVVWIEDDVLDGPGNEPCERDADLDTTATGPWTGERTIYLKDTWRFLSNDPDTKVMAEHEIYEKLHQVGTPNIPEHVAGGDIRGGRTQTQEMKNAPWLCIEPKISPYQHYRLVHGVIGRPLFKFENTKRLVTAVFDAVQAHAHAVVKAEILHRDISAGNIILTNEGRGLLIDWELAKMIGKCGKRRPDRTGTWQFMSANLLMNPEKIHDLADDLESFLHVLGWMTLRYVPAKDDYLPLYRGLDLGAFDQHYQLQGHDEQGGFFKSDALGLGSYPSRRFRPRCETPLFKLLRELRQPFKSLYGEPFTDEQRQSVQDPFNRSDDELTQLRADIDRYDQDIQFLDSSVWFINKMTKALDEKGWPADDKADENLPIAFPGQTEVQVQKWSNQLRSTHSLVEKSRGLPSSSKRRAASSTPEHSVKRPRGTPTTSGSGI